jgi:hypothetical protein
MSLEVWNLKTGHNALGTVKNESGCAKLENETHRPDTAKNESGGTEHEDGIRHPRYRRK